jgi:hypothetical protein
MNTRSIPRLRLPPESSRRHLVQFVQTLMSSSSVESSAPMIRWCPVETSMLNRLGGSYNHMPRMGLILSGRRDQHEQYL